MGLPPNAREQSTHDCDQMRTTWRGTPELIRFICERWTCRWRAGMGLMGGRGVRRVARWEHAFSMRFNLRVTVVQECE